MLTPSSHFCQGSMGEKGKQIRFIAGKYAGKQGWEDLARQQGDKTIPVIVDLGKRGEKETYVYNSSYVLNDASSLPGSYAEAVIQQCPDLEKMLVATCRAFAKTDIGRDPEGFHRLFNQHLHQAVYWQRSKGSKALYRSIAYQDPQPQGPQRSTRSTGSKKRK